MSATSCTCGLCCGQWTYTSGEITRHAWLTYMTHSPGPVTFPARLVLGMERD